MPRILHILDHGLPLHSGYAFRTRAIMKAQLAAGLEVAGITSQRHQASGGSDESEIETVDGLDFFRTPGTPHGPFPLRELRDVAALARQIEQVCKQWTPDILHAHSPMLNGLAAMRAREKTGLPLLYEIRAFWEDAAVGNGTGQEGSPKYWLKRQLENHVIAGADAIAVICEGLKSDLLDRGIAAEKIMVSPNGVDHELFGNPPERDAELARSLGLDGKTVIGFIGSIYDYEGLDDLISAMPELVARHPDARLLLVGGGPMEYKLQAQALASPVSHAIHFTGRVPHQLVERYYSIIDVLAYPRKAMRLTDLVTPLKPLEAMAQGRLVAASDVGGHRELIRHGETGTLFPAGDPSAMAAALADLIGDPDRWPGLIANGRNFVATERDWARNIERYQPVYQELLDRAAKKDGQWTRAA
ncbi:MAG: glycosyltransferase, exosortase A system-associated [Blastomonas sp.]